MKSFQLDVYRKLIHGVECSFAMATCLFGYAAFYLRVLQPGKNFSLNIRSLTVNTA